ncbi:MAG: PAS domain S-box protein [Bacteroidia bacterium]|nr:PAS domain S-box protein [Bacteroidia bacterium]
MKNLKSLSNHLRNTRLKEFAEEYVRQVSTMEIPLMKLFSHLSEDQLIQLSVKSSDDFLLSLENESALEKVKANLELWKEDKLPEIRKNEIHPTDLILFYAAQKKALYPFIAEYADTAVEAIGIIAELEDFYTKAQTEGMQTLFKIQTQTDVDLKESEKMYHLLVNEVVDYSIIILDVHGMIVSWNKGAEKINGYKEEEIKAKHFSVFYTEKEISAGKPVKVLEEVAKHGKYTYSDWRIRKDKSLFWADIVISELKDEKGKLKGFVKITRDLSEQQKANEEISLKTEELKRSNKELEQFAYIASHDLQEPLRVVTSYVQLLAERYNDTLDEEANKFVKYAIEGTTRMQGLINSLLEYSRINRNKKFEMVNVEELLDETVKDLAVAIKEKNVKLKYEKMPVIYADRVLMGQLFFNLISNAIKFSGDKLPEVIISAKTTKNEFRFSVKDNGIGIKEEYFEKVFVIFQRLHTREKYPGTGIGLAICKKIVEQHEGKIWVESEPGKGSDFHFTIKRKKEGDSLPAENSET